MIFFSQLTQTSPPEFMSSTLQELGIGTYQNVAMVSGDWSRVSVIIDCIHSFFTFGVSNETQNTCTCK